MMLTTALAGILMLIFVVVIHEGGHALAARLCGVGVAEFGIGFGAPRIRLFQTKNFPVYLCLWLLGGYVRLKSKKDEKSLNAEGKFLEDAALWQKVFIFSAGILANLISAVILRMIIFIFVPEGVTIKFLIIPVKFAAAPVWYLIPLYAVKFVVVTFGFWFKMMSTGIVMIIPELIKNILFLTPVPQSGVIGIVGLASTIHSGFWFYLGTIYYFSIILAALNLLPIYPLDGGQIVLEMKKKVIRRLFGEGKILKWSIKIYTYLGLVVILLLLLNVVISDLGDIFKFFFGG